MKAVVDNAGAHSGTNSVFQTTQYVYGVTTAGGSEVNSNDLLAKVQYPDKTSGSPGSGTSYAEVFAYDALGETTSVTDRNGSVHAYDYDVLGRMTTDNVVTLGGGVDGGVRRLDYTYDTAGRPFQFTSRSGTNATSTVVNEVQRLYNGYGQLTTEYQARGGSVNASTTPKVQFAYTEGGTDVTNLTDDNSRLTKIIYPNGRVLRYEYGASDSLSNRISRLAFLADQANGAASTHIEEYSYLGLSTVVIRNRPSANSKLTYVGTPGDAGDQYAGLDRFGRVVDQQWVGQSGSSTTTLDRFSYGYDADSNPLFKNNLGSGTAAATFSELYHANGTNGASTQYDGLNRLTGFRRGTLSDTNGDNVMDTVATANTLSGSSKSWGLDAVGNWNSTTNVASVQTRTHNKQNEVTAVGAAALTFDNNGNTTTDEHGKFLKYDAWNRLATYSGACGGCGGTVTYESDYYDALGRRIKSYDENGVGAEFAYSDQWQVLEETPSLACGGPLPTGQSQYVWSPTYVDELIERDRDADQAADGALDTSFDTDGKLTTSFGSTSGAMAVAVQPDGKTVVVGSSGGNGGEFAVARYNLDGSLDSSFGTGGKVNANFGAGYDQAYAVVLQPDGKIVVGGSQNTSRLALARYNADGSLDTSFDGDGKVTTLVTSGNWGEEVMAVALQADGKIITTGYTVDPGTGNASGVVARYNADGSLDTSFDGDGIKLISTSGVDVYANTVAIQPADGQVVVGLNVFGAFKVERLSGTDGAVDTSFGSSGVASATFGGINVSGLQGLTLQPDGKILATGIVSATGGSAQSFGVARFTVTGGLDSTFDGDGQVTTAVSTNAQAYAVRVQSNGQIVVAGAGGSDFGLARYNEDGSLDTSFDFDGKVTTDLGSFDLVTALWLGPDYKITVVGQSGSGSAVNFAAARYKVTSSLEERLYAQTDANHNVTSISDVFGAVQERFVYDPYGGATTLTSSWATTSETRGWKYLHQGGRYDSTTGLYSFRFRDYSASLGSWIEPDPMDYSDGASRYQARRSNPIGCLDPLGLISIAVPVGGLGGAGAVGAGGAGGAGMGAVPVIGIGVELGIIIWVSGAGEIIRTTQIGEALGGSIAGAIYGSSVIASISTQIYAETQRLVKELRKVLPCCECWIPARRVLTTLDGIFGPANDWPQPRAFFSHYDAAFHQKMYGRAAHLAAINAVRVRNGQGTLPPPGPDHLTEVRNMSNTLTTAVERLDACLKANFSCTNVEKQILYAVLRAGKLGKGLTDAL
jgi:uncharacterized delta-60 repeat protein/RHS repeat-associated protein